MDSLNTIPVSGNFGDIRETLNDNFGKLSQSLTTLENTRFDSAYSVYVETTTDNPVKTKEEWADSLRVEILVDKDQFAKNTSTTLPPSIYQDTVPAISAGEYLWVRRYTSFTDGTVSTSIPRVTMGDVSALNKKIEASYIEKSLPNYVDIVNNIISGYTINSSGNVQASASWKMIEINLDTNFVYGDYIAISDFHYDSLLTYWAIYDKVYTDATKVSRGFGVLNSPDTIIYNNNGGYLYFGVTNGSDVFDYSRMTVNKYSPDKRRAEYLNRSPVVAERVKTNNFTLAIDLLAENVVPTGTIVQDSLINSKFEIQTLYAAGWKYIEIPIPSGEENIFISGIESPSTSGFYYRILDANNYFLQSGSLIKNSDNHIRLLKKAAKIQFNIRAATDTTDDVFANLFVSFKGMITEINGNKLGGYVSEGADVQLNSVTAEQIQTDVLVLGNTPIWDEVSANTIVSGQIYLKQDGVNYILKVKG